jgi:hypothetical protein
VNYKDLEVRKILVGDTYCNIFDGCSNRELMHATRDTFKHACDTCPLEAKHNLDIKALTYEEIIEQVDIHLLLN